MLLTSFGRRRPTGDADARAQNMLADESAVVARVVAIAGLADPDDGVDYLTETVKVAGDPRRCVLVGRPRDHGCDARQ